MWGDDLHTSGGSVDLSASRTLARFRQTSILGRRGGLVPAGLVGAGIAHRVSAPRVGPPRGLPQGRLPGLPGGGGRPGAPAAVPRGHLWQLHCLPPLRGGSAHDPLGPHLGTPGPSPRSRRRRVRGGLRGAGGRRGPQAQGGLWWKAWPGPGRASPWAGAARRAMERSLDDDDDDVVGSGRGTPGERRRTMTRWGSGSRGGWGWRGRWRTAYGARGAGTPPVQAPPQRLQSIASVRFIDAAVRLVDERPEELWPPPLEHRATWVVKNKDGTSSLAGAGAPGAPGAHQGAHMESGAYLEALLDSMGMSLVCQESFGQLTLVEKKGKPALLEAPLHLHTTSRPSSPGSPRLPGKARPLHP